MRGWTEIEDSSLSSRRREQAEVARNSECSASLPRRLPLKTLSAAGRERMLSLRGEPLFLANWERTLMIHFEVEPAALQKVVPFELDLKDGRAFVSVVAFRLRGMRPRFGGPIAGW